MVKPTLRKSRFRNYLDISHSERNIVHSMFKTRCIKFNCLFNAHRSLPLKLARYQTNSKVSFLSLLISQCVLNLRLGTLSLPSLPPALLERARSVSDEHAQISKKLAASFDPVLAKRLGELSVATRALQNWETASNVGLDYL